MPKLYSFWEVLIPSASYDEESLRCSYFNKNKINQANIKVDAGFSAYDNILIGLRNCTCDLNKCPQSQAKKCGCSSIKTHKMKLLESEDFVIECLCFWDISLEVVNAITFSCILFLVTACGIFDQQLVTTTICTRRNVLRLLILSKSLQYLCGNQTFVWRFLL